MTLKILRFFENRPLLENFQNYVPKVFIATPIDVLCSNFVKFGRQQVGEIVRCLPGIKFRMALQLSLLRGSHPNICQGQPPQCADSAPDFIQIGLFSAECVNTAKTRHTVNRLSRDSN